MNCETYLQLFQNILERSCRTPCSAKYNMNPQRPTPPKRRLNLTDIVLFLAALFLLFNTPWGNTNSFHHLMFFLYVLCVMLRLSNIRKQGKRQLEQAKKQAQQDTQSTPEQTNSEQIQSTNPIPIEQIESDSATPIEVSQADALQTAIEEQQKESK